jgi:hypothetical protein
VNARRLVPALMAALLTTFILGVSATAKTPGAASAVSGIPVNGTFVDSDGAGTFTGTLDIERFVARDRALFAVGTIDGTLTTALGATRVVTNQPVTLPVTRVSVGTAPRSAERSVTIQQVGEECQILHLEFGGITLNVLGIMLQLSPISLDLSLGGLLGGILCGLLGALGGGAAAPAQANILNNALGLAR